MTSGRGPNTAWTSPATSVLIADRQCASRHCRNHSISRAPPVAALLGPSLAASAVRRSSPTCTHRAWRSRRAMEGQAASFLRMSAHMLYCLAKHYCCFCWQWHLDTPAPCYLH